MVVLRQLVLSFSVVVFLCFVFFFFFQAEDGIRDHCVTGVQTCALPISYRRGSSTPARTAKAARATRAAPATAIRRPRRPVSGPREGMLERWLGPPSAAANSSAVANRSSGSRRSEERRVGKEWRSRSSPG